jgi:hypothetical protein
MKEQPVTIKSIQGEDGPEAEERLYQGLLLLLRIAAEEDASERLQEIEGRDTPAA